MTPYELFGNDQTERMNDNCYVLGQTMFYLDDQELSNLKDHVRALAIAEIIEEASKKRARRK
jgi:hypothetical protein